MAPEYQLTIASNDLNRVIRTVRRVGTDAGRPAFLRVGTDELTLDWCGAAATAPCVCDAPFSVRLPGVAMRTMATAGKRLTGSVEVTRTGDRLNFGKFSVPCEPLEDDTVESLPVGAGDLEILAVALSKSRAVVSEMGLNEEVIRVQQRLTRTVDHVADALKWLKIDRGLVRSWVEAHVRARALGGVSFEISRELGNDGNLQ